MSRAELIAPSREMVEDLSRLDWDFADADTNRLSQALHPYPAKFIPQIPEQLISALTQPGDLVVDPFSGSGTVAVECHRMNRHFLGIDANPLAVLLGRVSTTPVSERQLDLAEKHATDLSHGSDWSPWLPDIPNIDKWFAPDVARQLARWRCSIEEVDDAAVRDLLLISFSKVVGQVSFQESETRYVSRPREIEPVEVDERMRTAVRAASKAVSQVEASDSCVTFIHGDATDEAAWSPVEDASAQLVVTSPPYPNAYDYHLYHRFRLFWLGFDPRELRTVEIGSHLTNQRLNDPVSEYEECMSSVLGQVARGLKGNAYASFVVGDGIHDGEVYDTAEGLQRLAAAHGFQTEVVIDRELPTYRRSVTAPGRRLSTEQIVLLRREDTQ